MYVDNRYYREYQRMLVRLHALIAAGRGDSPEALELREDMDEPEAHLSDSEATRLNTLSGDLSMTHDREIPDRDVAARVPAVELPLRLMDAYDRKDWDELLALLRADVSTFLRPEQIAYMRSRAYEALGELAPALAFMDEAARRLPSSPNYPSVAMEMLWTDQQYDAAYARARECLGHTHFPARVLLTAGGIVCRRAHQDPLPTDLIAAAARAIEVMERALPDEHSPAIRYAAFGSLGLLAARLGDQAKALAALTDAVGIEAAPEKQLATRGLLFAEMELIRAGRLQSAEERSLARHLANGIVPDRYAMAA